MSFLDRDCYNLVIFAGTGLSAQHDAAQRDRARVILPRLHRRRAASALSRRSLSALAKGLPCFRASAQFGVRAASPAWCARTARRGRAGSALLRGPPARPSFALPARSSFALPAFSVSRRRRSKPSRPVMLILFVLTKSQTKIGPQATKAAPDMKERPRPHD